MNQFVNQMKIDETSTSAKLEFLAIGIWPKYATAIVNIAESINLCLQLR